VSILENLVNHVLPEILRKSLSVTRDLFVQTARRNSIKLREIEVDHYLLITNQVDSPLDELNRYG
jgi:hypothetical protein